MNQLLNFQMSGKLIFGNGAINNLPDLIHKLNCKKPLLVTDEGIINAGICKKILNLLEDQDIPLSLFEEVEPDPRIEVVYACQEKAGRDGCDIIIGLGGGSSLDVSKVASILMTNKNSLDSYIGIDKIPAPGIPTIMIPTTSGTGSEVTPIAILSDTKEHLKKGIVSDYLYPSLALVDPELTVTLPPYITAYTGIDALTHAIEAFTNRFAKPFVDTFAKEAIRLISTNLPLACKDGNDSKARYYMALGSLYGGMCLGPVNTAAVHALAYPLGGMFDVPHGVANSLLLPYVMKVNLDSNYPKFAEIARLMGMETEKSGDEEAAHESVEAVTRLSHEIGIISKIRELNIPESAIPSMAEGAMKVTRLLNNNPKELTFSDVKNIYTNAY